MATTTTPTSAGGTAAAAGRPESAGRSPPSSPSSLGPLTYWTLGALFIVSVGLSVAITAGAAANFANNPGNKAGFDATQTSLGAFFDSAS